MQIPLVRQRGKRWLDLCLTVPAVVLLAPVAGGVALLIALCMGRPVLFRQRRPGQCGRPFTLVKFRSMTDERDEHGRLKPDRDRTTALGRFLRHTSLDELPQLWNVLRGEISLVGPRPLLMEYLPHYSAEHLRRHSVMPGITGWAQVHGRNALSFGGRLELDLWYVNHWSLWLDLKILARTVVTVLRTRGPMLAQPLDCVDDLGLHPETRRRAGLQAAAEAEGGGLS